jgi:hypothetical protein
MIPGPVAGNGNETIRRNDQHREGSMHGQSVNTHTPATGSTQFDRNRMMTVKIYGDISVAEAGAVLHVIKAAACPWMT